MSEIETQKVWRTLSSDLTGYYVWEIIEYQGETPKEKPRGQIAHQFTEAADGTYFMEMCYHFFTKDKAEEFLVGNIAPWTNLIIIKTAIKKGDWVRSSRFNLVGIVKEVVPCGNHNCNKRELTLNSRGSGTRFYHHTEYFEVMTEAEILKWVCDPSAT